MVWQSDICHFSWHLSHLVVENNRYWPRCEDVGLNLRNTLPVRMNSTTVWKVIKLMYTDVYSSTATRMSASVRGFSSKQVWKGLLVLATRCHWAGARALVLYEAGPCMGGWVLYKWDGTCMGGGGPVQWGPLHHGYWSHGTPLNRKTDRHLWKHYFLTPSLVGSKN